MLSWEDIIQKYIVKYSNLIGKVTKPLQHHFGIGYFTYHRIDYAGNYTVLVNRPDWAEHYVGKQIFLNDPYLRHPSNYRSGVSLMENQGSEEQKELIVKNAKKVLEVDMGVSFIQKGETFVEFFGFSSSRKISCLESIYLNRPQVLTSFAAYFKKEMGVILKQMEEEAPSLVDLKGKDFFSDQPLCLDIASPTLLAYYRDLGIHREIEKAETLSCRERECLKLLLRDKSAKETASILGLSPRTVEYYFENIKNKLSCWNKREVLQIARNLRDLGLL